MAGVDLNSIVKKYGAVQVVHGIDLSSRGKGICRACWPFWLWQIDDPAHDRRSRGNHRR